MPPTDTSRRSLDQRLEQLRPTTRFAAPASGWIKAIRQALGMTTGQLAKRLGVAQPTVMVFEQSELRGTMQLSTLKRVAEALGCTVVYALVPNKPLQEAVDERARLIARRRLSSVAHTMLLENQSVPPKELEAQIDELAKSIKPRSLWNEP